MVSLMKDSHVIPVNTYKYADVHLMDGRSYVESCRERFDLIQLMFTELYVPFPNSLAFVENYLYTVEAFRAYLKRLNERGIIFVNKWVGNYETPTELLRITTTAYEALKREGIENPGEHFIIVGYFISGWKTNGGYVLIKKEPFNHKEIIKVKESLGEPMYLLYSPEDKELNNPFSAFFKESDINSFYERAPLNISPTYDDRPYLNQFDKKLTEHWKLLAYLVIISSVLLFLIFKFLKKNLLFSKKIYYSLIAIIFIAVGYMWIELILVQKFNILLGSPVLSMGIILVSFFFANGVGSYVISILTPKLKKLFLATIPVFLFILEIALPVITKELLDENSGLKIFSGILTSAVIGFVLGTPFPVLLNSIKKYTGDDKLSLFISFDGVFSVLAVGLIMLLSVIYGFNILLEASAFLYIPGIILLFLLIDE
jgi:predicted membrane-bound spermidine synthase